jgi:hypothetical protein
MEKTYSMESTASCGMVKDAAFQSSIWNLSKVENVCHVILNSCLFSIVLAVFSLANFSYVYISTTHATLACD